MPVTSSIPDDVLVFDAVSHALNLDPENYRVPSHAKKLCEMLYSMVNDGMKGEFRRWAITRESHLRDWSIEETATVLFLESRTQLSTFVPLIVGSFYDGICAVEKAAEIVRRWPDRFLVEATVDPLAPGALEEFERQVELLQPVALKLYPSSYFDGVHHGWKMDDPEVAYPLFEKALELGVKTIAIHKAIPIGPVPMESYRVEDLDYAASNFPDLTFEVIHGGASFSEETAWQLARYDNILINLDITSLMCVTNPRRFGQFLIDMLAIGGYGVMDRIIWGTGGGPGAFHPQLALEAFWNYQIPEDLFAQAAFDMDPYVLTEEDKRKVLGLNYVRVMGLDDVQERLDRVAGDEFSRRVAENGGLFEPWSTTKAELLDVAQAA